MFEMRLVILVPAAAGRRAWIEDGAFGSEGFDVAVNEEEVQAFAVGGADVFGDVAEESAKVNKLRMGGGDRTDLEIKSESFPLIIAPPARHAVGDGVHV